MAIQVRFFEQTSTHFWIKLAKHPRKCSSFCKFVNGSFKESKNSVNDDKWDQSKKATFCSLPLLWPIWFWPLTEWSMTDALSDSRNIKEQENDLWYFQYAYGYIKRIPPFQDKRIWATFSSKVPTEKWYKPHSLNARENNMGPEDKTIQSFRLAYWYSTLSVVWQGLAM